MHKRRHHDKVHFNLAANYHEVAKEENGTSFAELESNDVLHSKINGQTSMQQILDTLYTVLQQLLHHFLYGWPCSQSDLSVPNGQHAVTLQRTESWERACSLEQRNLRINAGGSCHLIHHGIWTVSWSVCHMHNTFKLTSVWPVSWAV